MENYEPELMYALDSKSEYADWKNVYNVSGNDVCYCPICLGRVKLWNGQDPNKAYMKQRCFHHIDGMCSQESRIHFAYKYWLLKEHGEFMVNGSTYEIQSVEIEKEYATPFGKYRPDVTIFAKSGKQFFLEIANTNKKTDDYIMKWDKLGCDVLELDVNEQLETFVLDQPPILKLIYSAENGVCYIKKYTNSEYSDFITERKTYWSRQDIINYKIQWENLDWFWLSLQKFYVGKKNINSVIDSFVKLCPADQVFICKHLKGKKHKSILFELEKHYTSPEDKKRIKYKQIDILVKDLNKQFGFSEKNGIPYLCRKKNILYFFKESTSGWKESDEYYIERNTTLNEIKEYFLIPMNKENELIEEMSKKINDLEKKHFDILKKYGDIIKKSNLWDCSLYILEDAYRNPYYEMKICLLSSTCEYLKFYYDDKLNDKDLKSQLTSCMNCLMQKVNSYNFQNLHGIRIMEVRKDGE